MDPKALFNIPYGLFMLSANAQGRDNACIVNTVMQVTDNPRRVAVAVNKANHTHDMIADTGIFTASVLTELTPFSIFERFGFKSGRDTDKFLDFDGAARGQNGLLYLTGYANAAIEARVAMSFDLGTHTMFVGDVTDAVVLSDCPSVTYSYYQEHIKPKPQPKQKGYVCRICGYIYHGDVLPADFICPLCKHGVDDFEPLE